MAVKLESPLTHALTPLSSTLFCAVVVSWDEDTKPTSKLHSVTCCILFILLIHNQKCKKMTFCSFSGNTCCNYISRFYPRPMTPPKTTNCHFYIPFVYKLNKQVLLCYLPSFGGSGRCMFEPLSESG